MPDSFESLEQLCMPMLSCVPPFMPPSLVPSLVWCSLGQAFVLALPLGGVVSVLLYRRLSSGIEPSPRTGFRLGALSGLFVFGLLMVLIAAGTLARHNEGELHEQVVKIVQQAQARNPDPQARQALEYFLTPQGMTFMMIVGFIFLCVLFVLLSGVGGAVSASLLRRKAPPGQ